MPGGSRGRTGGDDRKPRGISPLELVFSGAGLLLTLGMVAFIVWEALTRSGDVRPAVTVEATEIRQEAGVWIVGFEAVNHTPATAAGVEIEGTLSRDGRVVETGRASLDYVPGDSLARGGLFFGADPRAHELEIRALGYSEP